MNKKLFLRLLTGVHYASYALFSSVFNFLISIFIVRIHSPHLWGEFAQFQIVLLLVSLVGDWGQKEFLLKNFSQGKKLSLWKTSLSTRAILFFFISPVLVGIYGLEIGILLITWSAAHVFFRSFDSIIIFTRKFTVPFALDVSSFGIIIVVIISTKDALNVQLLISLFALVSALKGIYLLLYFRKKITESHKPLGEYSRFQYLVESFPFFLPSVIGFLQSKIDTFTVAYFLEEESLGKYYVLMNLLMYCQLSALMLFTPYKKNIYRLRPSAIQKIAYRSFLLGIGWSVAGVTCIFLITKYGYRFDFDIIHFSLATLTVVPYFYYFVRLYQLFSLEKTYLVSITFSLSAMLNFIVSIVLIPRYMMEGALIANAVSQWSTLFFLEYFLRFKTKKDNSVIPA